MSVVQRRENILKANLLLFSIVTRFPDMERQEKMTGSNLSYAYEVAIERLFCFLWLP